MLSLRALARAVPCSTSRIITSIARPSFNTSIRSQISRQAPRIAAFSTTRLLQDEHSQQLAAKLGSEIALEKEESAQQADSDHNIEAFKTEAPYWTIEDSEGEQDVFLKRKYEDEEITVHFSIADFNSVVDEYGESDTAMGDEEEMDVPQSGGGNTKGAINQGRTSGGNLKVAPEDSIAPADREELADDESEAAPQYPVGVSVLVQRPDRGALKFYLRSSEGDFIIDQLVQLPKSLKGDAKALLRDAHDTLYAGPPFAQLDEEVQGILESYLNARGLTEYLAQVIPDYIDVKEQKEYLGWLTRVKDFVE